MKSESDELHSVFLHSHTPTHSILAGGFFFGARLAPGFTNIEEDWLVLIVTFLSNPIRLSEYFTTVILNT